MSPDFDVKSVALDMVGAVKGVLSNKWPEVKDYAEEEMEKIAKRTELIIKKFTAGEINQDEAKILLQMQKNAAAGTLAILEGVSRLMAEQGVNAALGVLKKAIGTLLPFDLIG
jgi:hypothetical protein